MSTMNEKSECLSCKKEISIYRVFCSKDCERRFYRMYPEAEKKEWRNEEK